MKKMNGGRGGGSGGGFTLIELLVVIAIIALLIGILLPSLAGARDAGRAIKCAAQIRSVGIAVTQYTAESKEYFPPSYVYGDKPEGYTWKLADQQASHPIKSNGYIHWSGLLFSSGTIPESAFTCPSVEDGGAPATNPGRGSDHWESGQIDDMGRTSGSAQTKDRQVSRIAFAGNDAIFSRNKFATSTGVRLNKFVRAGEISDNPSRLILASEIANHPTKGGWASWKTTDPVSGETVYKTHRPITMFEGRSAGKGDLIYGEPPRASGSIPSFRYPHAEELASLNDAAGQEDWIANMPAMLVGQNHARRARGSGSKPGEEGKTNFVYLDGHIETSTLFQSIKEMRWGTKFYSITGGANGVDKPVGY